MTWIFFRATSLHDAWYVLTHLASGVPQQLSLITHDPAARTSLLFLDYESSKLILAVAAVVALMTVERVQQRVSIRLHMRRWPAALRWLAYSSAVLLIMTFGVFGGTRFIYFQF